MRFAFKEWGVICSALAEGKQSLILRKGGIAEESGLFKPEHDRFWLYPTAFHQQQQDGIKPDGQSLPRIGGEDKLRLTHFVEVTDVIHVENESTALAFDRFHLWTPETVSKRFHYRKPGLYILITRIFSTAKAIELSLHPAWDGCKTWVDLGHEVEPIEPKPVLEDEAFEELHLAILQVVQR
jgi:hypothetical protein